MTKAPLPPQEEARLAYLESLKILDSPEEEDYQEIVELASEICGTPISCFTLVDGSRHWFKARKGLDNRQTDRDISFCAHAILEDQFMEVDNALEDDRFADNPLVTGDPHIRFYAGMPLFTHDGFGLGTLCVIDREPRNLTSEQKKALKILAKQIMVKLELREKVNELKSTMNQLHQQNIHLEKENKTNYQVLSMIAHDLRGPYASLQGLLGLFSENLIDQKTTSSLVVEMQQLTKSTQSLLEDLLVWGTAQFNDNSLDIRPLSLHKMVEDLVQAAQPAAILKKNVVLSDLVEDFPIRADEQQLRFVLRNLIGNANKFCENGMVQIQAKNLGNQVRINIRDTGIGMRPDQIKQLFNFEKNKSTPGTQGEKGTGLGLFVCKSIIEKHKGNIMVESQVGKGSTFSIFLPN
ncbi:MAG: GAF domain-containing sensor histidine kinase [Chitinophagaceae bacterium]